MIGKLNLFLVTISIAIVFIHGSPLPERGHDPFRHAEVVVPVPIIYTNEDSYENILDTGSYRYDGTTQPKATAVSTSSNEEEGDDNDDNEDEEAADEDSKVGDAKGPEQDADEDEDDDETKGDSQKPEDGDDEDENEEDDTETEGGEREGKTRKEKYLFGSGINDSYGWYGWPNDQNYRRHHSHNHHHHHQPTYHSGFFTTYF